MNERDLPGLYRAADAASKGAQRRFLAALGCNLGSLVFSAVLSVINYPATWFAVAQAVLLLIGLVMALYLAFWQPQRIWYGMRALAESIKTISWRYMMRAEPYDLEHGEAARHFSENLLKVLAANRQICTHAAFAGDHEQITPAMQDCRESDIQERRCRYLDERILDQLAWYERKARMSSRDSRFWFSTLLIANALAVMTALLKIEHPAAQYWPTDIFAAAAGAIMAWLQTKRFQELAASYALTAHEISILRAGLPAGNDEGTFSTFVGDAENAFSREHTQWQARRDAD